jgi:hypothetical protein
MNKTKYIIDLTDILAAVEKEGIDCLDNLLADIKYAVNIKLGSKDLLEDANKAIAPLGEFQHTGKIIWINDGVVNISGVHIEVKAKMNETEKELKPCAHCGAMNHNHKDTADCPPEDVIRTYERIRKVIAKSKGELK